MSEMPSNETNFELNKKSLEELKEICQQIKYKISKDLIMLYSQFDDNKNNLLESFKDNKSGDNFDYIELTEMNFDLFYHSYTKIKNEIKIARKIQFHIDDVECKDKYAISMTESVS